MAYGRISWSDLIDIFFFPIIILTKNNSSIENDERSGINQALVGRSKTSNSNFNDCHLSFFIYLLLSQVIVGVE